MVKHLIRDGERKGKEDKKYSYNKLAGNQPDGRLLTAMGQTWYPIPILAITDILINHLFLTNGYFLVSVSRF